MLRTRLVMPLAFASMAFLWGCQEPGSSPTGPDGQGPLFTHKGTDKPHGGPKGGGDDPATTPTLGFADGMVTSGFAVTVKERTNLLQAEKGDFLHDIQMNFMQPGTCVGFKGTKSGVFPEDDEVASLVDELSRLVTGGYFIMQIDKPGLTVGGYTTSDIHFLDVERDGTFDGDAGSTRILLGSPFRQVDPVTVKWVSSAPEVDVFEFTGPVVVWASKVGGGGGSKSDRIIQCSGTGGHPNLVTVTVNR